MPDKEQKCLTENQTRHVYKKVETDKVINVETMKQEIENYKITRNRSNEEDTTETNPYQMVILNKVYKDDIKTEQMIHWSIRSDLIKYIDRILLISHSVVTFEEVDFLWNRTVDSLKTSFHLLL